ALYVLPPSVAEVLVAVAIGLVIANAGVLPASLRASTRPGIQFAVKRLLRAGIVLLGARLSLHEVVAIGASSIGLVVVLMTCALVFALIVGRALKLPPRLCVLIGVGTSVCGNTAIVATAPVIGADEREVSFAVATITLIGTAAVLLYPIIGHAIDLSATAYGTWCGVAVNDTSQVVAASAAYDPHSLDVASVVKLTRNALMAPLLVGIALFGAPRLREQGARTVGARAGALNAVPLFVVGFLALSLLRTLDVVSKDMSSYFDVPAKALILCALAGVGLQTVVGDLRKTGPKPFVLGLCTAILTASLGLFGIHLLAL
ncbi:MAG TPA: putative sulfate exporter family transporter, partial [Myxococcota bacterium]